MPGPNGESCGTCYFYDQIDDGPYGYCRHENADSWIQAKGSQAERLWPRVHADLDWSGDWRDRDSPLSDTLAIGSFVTPAGTTFNVTDTVNYIRYNPGNLLDGAIMYNVTLVDGQLQVDIPGNYPIGTQWVATISFYGSVNFPDPNTFVQFAPTIDDALFNADITQKLSTNPTTDDIDLAFSMSGVGVGAQTINTEIGVRGDIGLASFTSLVYQVSVVLL